MFKKLGVALNKRVANERGQSLVLVLLLLSLGGLMVMPLMDFVTTGVKSGLIYERKADELYAADAGVQDATWQIKHDHLDTLFTSPAYSPYDYTTTWNYSLSNQVNDKDVDITIDNVWVPQNIAAPDPAGATAIIDAEKLMVTGGATGITYTIEITYTPGAQEDLRVTTIGIWLPRGFSYVDGSSNLEANPSSEYYAVPVTQSHAGNQAVLWTFNSVPFADFPGVTPQDSPMITEITFQFTSVQPASRPAAVAWITTSGVADIPYSWDVGVKVYKITSEAGTTFVETYIAKEEIRKLSSAIAGDYRAIGGTLMIDQYPDGGGPERDTLLPESDATVSDIPPDAEVGAAYLYWSGWRDEDSKQTLFSDSGADFGEWISGSAWSINSGRFRSHYSSGAESTRYLTLKNSLDLSSYEPGTVTVSWDQYEGGTLEADDGLDFAFSADDGVTWSSNYQAFRDDIGGSAVRYSYVIPSQYLSDSFKLRFYAQGFDGSSEYCYLDNIAVSTMPVDNSVVFKINGQQVYFDADDEPQQGLQPLTADSVQVLENRSSYLPGSYFYAAKKDVTELVQTFSPKAPDPATNHPGNATYTVGDVDATWDANSEIAYAGWSLVIIYTSYETKGHQFYLYDTFVTSEQNNNVDFDNDGQPGGNINGFLVPNPVAGEVNAVQITAFVGEGDNYYPGDYLRLNGTKLWDGTTSNQNSAANPNNVWNDRSIGMNADGVDVDTFHVTWASGLLRPGDTSAQVDLQTNTDIWQLVYIILSFRSEATTGGALSYLIYNR
ncbi:MAG: hypothetical protein HY665_01905 [Chloroflexi bacterium]|nr:hypothetical protein [Chloroflexota bacterium]